MSDEQLDMFAALASESVLEDSQSVEQLDDTGSRQLGDEVRTQLADTGRDGGVAPPTLDDDSAQLALLDVAPDWRETWRGMPEFVQRDLQPVQSLTVHFAKREDVRRFAQLVEQPISPLTISLWYPKVQLVAPSCYAYVDESALSDLHPEQGSMGIEADGARA